MWVSPFDVEAALVSHEAVLEAAVIGKEDADGLVKPKAFIVLRNGYVADERLLEMLKIHVKEHARSMEISALDRCADGIAAYCHRQDLTLQAPRRRRAIGGALNARVVISAVTFDYGCALIRKNWSRAATCRL